MGTRSAIDAVDVGQLLIERAVDGRGHRQVGIALGVERSHERVIVDHVVVTHRFVGVEDVADLRDGHADPLALGFRQDPFARHGAGGIAGGEEENLVPGVLQPSGQLVDDQLDPSVEARRDGSPWGGDQSDPHTPIQPSATDR